VGPILTAARSARQAAADHALARQQSGAIPALAWQQSGTTRPEATLEQRTRIFRAPTRARA
jgi:hypothetical protein